MTQSSVSDVYLQCLKIFTSDANFLTIYVHTSRSRKDKLSTSLFLVVWTAVVFCCSVFQAAFSGVFKLRKTLQHALLLVLDDLSTSRPSWGNFTGCQYDSWPFWSTRRWTVSLCRTWRTTVTTTDRCYMRGAKKLHWAVDHSPLLFRVSETAFLYTQRFYVNLNLASW